MTPVFIGGAALLYLFLLFAIAHLAERGRMPASLRRHSLVYALSLGVYASSWTYYGSVGLASEHGLDFLPIYIGPILVIGLGAPFIARIMACGSPSTSRLRPAPNIASTIISTSVSVIGEAGSTEPFQRSNAWAASPLIVERSPTRLTRTS